jgi:hypothetical protein
MILSELNYYNSNSKQLLSFKEDDTRKNKTTGPVKDPISIENYENLKLEEIDSEIRMHHDFILSDIVPLMKSDMAMFMGSEELVKGLINFGANSVHSKSPPRFDSSPKDPITFAVQLDNPVYQKLIRELKSSLATSN